ncbi:hypothetical protein JG688_00016904 [Phytophthora aleatoria]|uniref:Uncharacterized protein n=1 Tax=Phytophthora aleatoria TaxID=2496075 RepID=A0A8J5I3Q9_9STRA|nr:hypothetical protein JG688_00016904 [Phytophthora aleatoria]
MSATTATTTTTSSSPVGGSPTKSPLSVQVPMLSPRKRKFSDALAASPTSLDEVAASSSADERMISPKKKAKAEERVSSDLGKWESHVVASIASALDLDCMTADDDAKDCCSNNELEPIAFLAAPAGDLAADELQILRHFLA